MDSNLLPASENKQAAITAAEEDPNVVNVAPAATTKTMDSTIEDPRNYCAMHTDNRRKWHLCCISVKCSMTIIKLKNLRIFVMMVAIYQVMISHILLFVMLLGLTHAEEMRNILIVDMADQKEREEYYEMPMNAKGESMNQIRFKSASQLASGTLTVLYGCAGLAAIYLFACLGLLWGTIKYRYDFMIPWLFVHLVGSIVLFVASVIWADPLGYEAVGGCKGVYWAIVVAVTSFDAANWLVSYRFYRTLKEMKRLTKSAIVSIPYREPRTVLPYHYRKENMYLGDGGHKHLLTESNPNYVV